MISLTVKHKDGSEGSFPVWPAIEVAFERHYKISYRKAFEDDVSDEKAYYLAWLAQRDANNEIKPFDEWIKTLADVKVEFNENPI